MAGVEQPGVHALVRHSGRGELGTTVRATPEAARQAVFACLGYYNHHRLHSTLDYRTPHEVRVGYRQGLALVA